MAGKVSVVVGGQFGSEGKGAVAGHLASQQANGLDTVVGVRVGGPNAGHTVYGNCPEMCTEHAEHDNDLGHPWRLRQVPVSAVTNPMSMLVIAAGSEIDFNVLFDEIDDLNDAGYNVSGRLYVDASATVLTDQHIAEEVQRNMQSRIGSTAKGIGAARADRIWRTADQVINHLPYETNTMCMVADTAHRIRQWLETGAHVVIEGTQGYGLGLHTKYYPQVTSGDCRAIDFLAQTGISPWDTQVKYVDVWVVARTNPIRVAGNSGPLKGETSWEDLGLQPEQTTVTKKTRRVGEWDGDLVRSAVAANGGPHNPKVKLALTMVDYNIPDIAGASSWKEFEDDTATKLYELIADIENQTGANVCLIGTGPTTMIHLR